MSVLATETTAAAGAPPIVRTPCPHYSAEGLRWPGHEDLEPFMRATYEAHVAWACRGRSFVGAVPSSKLRDVAPGQQLHVDAADDARRMLQDARNALRAAQAAGDPRALETRSFEVSSAYRSALRQYRLWGSRFPSYMAATEAERRRLPGGPTGAEAARWLARWIRRWLGAPGFSNHNAGRAVDLACRLTDRRVAANRSDIPRWRTTWLHSWLVANAGRYGFTPYEAEPWHWDHHGGPTASTASTAVATEAEVPGLPASGPAAYWHRQLRIALPGNTVEPLIDGTATFKAMRRAIESATGSDHFVYLLGWWVDPWVHLDGPGTSLLDLFAQAGKRGVQVRVLMWDPPRLFAGDHSKLHAAAVTAINRLPNCHAQQDAGGGLTSPKAHHQKLLVVNGRNGLVAFAGGVDVNADRIHVLPPPAGSYRRDRPSVGWTGSSGSGSGAATDDGTPLHDVHARLTGPTALPLMRAFMRRWWARSGDRGIDRTDPLRARWSMPLPRQTGRHWVRIGETFDGVIRDGSRELHDREVTVQDIWLRTILGARSFLYIEEQYLISLCAADAIRQVLPRLRHVTILITPSQISGLPGAWARRRAFVDRIVHNNKHASKLHIYIRTGSAPARGHTLGAHSYVHAKMAVADDEVLLIGSANCNNRGWETDSELVTATFEDARGPRASVAGRTRASLWSHHLGQPLAAVADPVASRGLWDTVGTRHVRRYDPWEGKDRIGSDRPDALVDPSDARPGDPCRTLLSPAGSVTPTRP
jgi:phosphatidylserine/phosphatidylglycerophosphate/cardiolipin synthase-like enzyme